MPSGHTDGRDDCHYSLYSSDGQEDVPSPPLWWRHKTSVQKMNGFQFYGQSPLVSFTRPESGNTELICIMILVATSMVTKQPGYWP